MEKPPKRFSRRKLLQAAGGLLTVVGLGQVLNKPYPIEQTPLERPQILGTSYSQVQCRHLGMSDAESRETYLKVLDLGFDLVRVGAYMDEIDERQFDFLDWQVNEAEKRDINLIINVGGKVQRFPEYHLPRKARERLNIWQIPNQTIGEDFQTFEEIVENTRNVVARYRNRGIVKYWQVENEAFDRLGFAGGHVIADSLLDAELEAAIAEKDPEQKILLSNAVNLPDSEVNFEKSLIRRPDGMGFNVYYRVPTSNGRYHELSNENFEDLRVKAEIIRHSGIEPIIFESQAEPWENGAVVHIEHKSYPSSNPELAIRLASKLAAIGYKTVLFWGSEYWIHQANRGNTEWLDKIKEYNSGKAA